jgi:hypothetical protein
VSIKTTIGLLLFLVSTSAFALTIDDFSEYKTGKFPALWRTWPFQRGKAKDIYFVKEENGRKYLSADDNNSASIQILRDFDWKPDYYPVLSWKWRARRLPVGANETNPATNDSACGVYAVISKARQEMIKWTWSTTAPVGTVYEKKPGKAYIIAINSGPKKLNTWVEHKVNVKEEYKKYFHEELDKNPVGIAILTDGNATSSPAACDYAEFRISGE